MPDRYSTLRYDSPSFLDVTGHILTIWIFVAFLFGVSQLTLLFKNPKVHAIGEKSRNYLIYNGIIRMVLASIVYFMLGSRLNLRFGINSSLLSIVNSMLSVIATVAIIWFTFHVLYITIKY